MSERRCINCRAATKPSWLCQDCVDKLVNAIQQTQAVSSTRRKRPLIPAQTQMYLLFSLYRWAGLIGGIAWAAAMVWALCVPLGRVWAWSLATWLSKPEGLWLVFFAVLSSSVMWMMLGMRFGLWFMTRQVRRTLKWPAVSQQGWKSRLKHLLLPSIRDALIHEPLILIAVGHLLLVWGLCFLVERPPHGWLPTTWAIYVTVLYLALSWPTTHLFTGDLLGWFLYSDWVGLLKERLPPQCLAARPSINA